MITLVLVKQLFSNSEKIVKDVNAGFRLVKEIGRLFFQVKLGCSRVFVTQVLLFVRVFNRSQAGEVISFDRLPSLVAIVLDLCPLELVFVDDSDLVVYLVALENIAGFVKSIRILFLKVTSAGTV